MPSEATGAVGTSYYISPEIVHGRLPHDEKVDLFRYECFALMQRALAISIYDAQHAVPPRATFSPS